MNRIRELVADEIGPAGGGDIMRLAPCSEASGDISSGQREQVQAVGSLGGNEDGPGRTVEANVTRSAGQDNPSADFATGEVDKHDSIWVSDANSEHSSGGVDDQPLGCRPNRKRDLRSRRGFGNRGSDGGLRHILGGPNWLRAAATDYEEQAAEKGTCKAGSHRVTVGRRALRFALEMVTFS